MLSRSWFLPTAKDFPPPSVRVRMFPSVSLLKCISNGLNLSGYFHFVPRTFRLTNLGRTSTRQYSSSRPYFVTIRWFLGMSQKIYRTLSMNSRPKRQAQATTMLAFSPISPSFPSIHALLSSPSVSDATPIPSSSSCFLHPISRNWHTWVFRNNNFFHLT